MDSMYNEDCFVAFLDILGFSNIVMSKSPKFIEEVFDTIKKCKDEITLDKCAWSSKYDDLSDNTIVYIMSDSVVLAIRSCIDGSLDFLVKWCKIIQSRLLLKHELLVRGGISQGLHYQKDGIAFGVGFVKAHSIENSADTPRIVIDEALVDQCGNNVLTDDDDNTYIDFLSDCYWDEETFDLWMSFANENMKKYENLVKKYQWLANQFTKCNDRYLLKEQEAEYSQRDV